MKPTGTNPETLLQDRLNASRREIEEIFRDAVWAEERRRRYWNGRCLLSAGV